MPHMELDVFKGDGWIVETDDGTVYAPDIDAPDADELRKAIGSGRRVTIGDVYGHVEAVTHVVGWWGRYSAPGYLDATPWLFNKNKRELLKELRDYYGSGNPPRARRGRVRRNAIGSKQRSRRLQPKRTARGRTQRNPLPRGRDRGLFDAIGSKQLTTKLKKSGGYVHSLKYEDANDHKNYVHNFEDLQAIMYLVEVPAFGKGILIVSSDDKPLWEDA